MKKLTLSELRIKSFIIQQDNQKSQIKAGALGSDGPPHTSSRHTEISCNIVLFSMDCIDTLSCDYATSGKDCGVK